MNINHIRQLCSAVIWILFLNSVLSGNKKLFFTDEENFVKLYGNIPNSSGIWQCVRNISSDVDRLKNIAFQAHKRANMLPTQIIETISVENKTLDFSYPKFEPIHIDTIVYTIPQLPKYPLFVSKGFAPDCIFYLTKWDNQATTFRLGIHFSTTKVTNNFSASRNISSLNQCSDKGDTDNLSTFLTYNLTVHVYTIVQIFFSPLTSSDMIERRFFELYGNDVNTSGLWEPVRSLASNADALTNISLQAHLGSWMGNNSETVTEAVFETGTLAANDRKYQNIAVDLIKYKVHRKKDGVRVKGPRSYFYLTKGMRPDCVHYCWMRGIDSGIFLLDYHVCDIVIPKT